MDDLNDVLDDILNDEIDQITSIDEIREQMIDNILSTDSPDTSYIMKWAGESMKHLYYVDEALKYEPENGIILFDIAYKLALQELYEYFFYQIREMLH